MSDYVITRSALLSLLSENRRYHALLMSGLVKQSDNLQARTKYLKGLNVDSILDLAKEDIKVYRKYKEVK